MKNEMTEVDIRKIQEELHHRKNVLGPELHAEVKRTREYGDLSENAEYKQAKYERNRNESRIRYLEGLLRTAIVVRDNPHRRGIGLLDYVEYLNERTGAVRRIQLVTSIRQDATKGYVSQDSPIGRALMGREAGERVRIEITPENQYYATIQKVERGTDNEDLPINRY